MKAYQKYQADINIGYIWPAAWECGLDSGWEHLEKKKMKRQLWDPRLWLYEPELT